MGELIYGDFESHRQEIARQRYTHMRSVIDKYFRRINEFEAVTTYFPESETPPEQDAQIIPFSRHDSDIA